MSLISDDNPLCPNCHEYSWSCSRRRVKTTDEMPDEDLRQLISKMLDLREKKKLNTDWVTALLNFIGD